MLFIYRIKNARAIGLFKAIGLYSTKQIMQDNESRHRFSRTMISTTIGLSLSGLSILIAPIANAADLPDPQASQPTPTWKNTIDQQQAWQDSLKKQRIDSLRQSQSLEPTPDTTVIQPESTLDSKQSACLPIQRIELGAMPELNKAAQTKLRQHAEQISVVSPLTESTAAIDQAQCISVTAANDLIRAITAAYLEAGFFKISIDPVQTGQGTSLWQVYVAKITDIDNQTDLPTSRLFGELVNKPANMAILDQAVSNGERVIDGPLLLDIFPVGKDVRIQVTQQQQSGKINSDIEWRYDPDDSYGHNQIKLHSTLRNVFGQADLTSLTIQQSLTDHYGYDEDNQRRSASIYTLIPNGRWQWSALLAADEYTRSTKLPNSVLEQTGDSWQANLRGDYTFDRDQDSISTVYGQVAHQDVSSELLGSQLDIQSPTLSSARIGATHTKLFNKRSKSDPRKFTTGAWVVDLSAEQGIGNHDNPATKQGLSDDYLRWLLSGYLSHQHPIIASGENKGYWQMTHELQGQYSNDQLYGISQQSLGSTYSGVRGIDKVYSAEESGASLRNTLSYEPMQSNWLTLGTQKIRWSPYIGADYGIVKASETDLKDDTSEAMSATLGLNFIGYDVKGTALDRRWLFDISASKADVDYADKRFDGTQDTEFSAALQLFF